MIDAAMVDGVSVLAQMMATGALKDQRESFLLDGGAPFYRVYETSDGGHMAVGSIEPQFFAQLLTGLGLRPDQVPNQFDQSQYDRLRAIFTERFASRTRDEWTAVFAGTDACVTPVLSWAQAAENEHLAARSTIVRQRRRRPGRACPTVFQNAVGPGRRSTEGHHRARRRRMVMS